MHIENVKSVQCDYSSKWKEGTGSWWGAMLLSFSSVQGFMHGVSFNEGLSNTEIGCSLFCSRGPKSILTAGVEVQTELDRYYLNSEYSEDILK